MRKAQTNASSEDLGRHGAWTFSRERIVGPELTLMFHDLYWEAFQPLRTRSMCRQTLTEAEFGAQMTNGRVVKYVAWDDTGYPVGMSAMTDDLEAVPWISPEYFAHRYPEQWARGAVWYFAFILAHPQLHSYRFLDQMVEVAIAAPRSVQAVCAYDMCAFNHDVLGLGGRLSRSFSRTTGVTPVEVDRQHYYALEMG